MNELEKEGKEGKRAGSEQRQEEEKRREGH
jgi:hypothetical protein